MASDERTNQGGEHYPMVESDPVEGGDAHASGDSGSVPTHEAAPRRVSGRGETSLAGTISDVHAFRRALTVAEIVALNEMEAAASPGPEEPGEADVERIARAIYDAMPEKGYHEQRTDASVPWEALTYAQKRSWLNAARAVQITDRKGGCGVSALDELAAYCDEHRADYTLIYRTRNWRGCELHVWLGGEVEAALGDTPEVAAARLLARLRKWEEANDG